MAKILAMRFSALGDVVMAMSVIKSFADLYPEHEITFVSRPFVGVMLEGMPENVHFRPVDLKAYKGVGGLRRLSKELAAEGYDAVADMHDVLRTKIVRFFLKRKGLKVAVIDKGRKERKKLTRRNDKCMDPLTPSQERYADVLAELGYPVDLEAYHIYGEEPADISDLKDIVGEKGQDNWVGIAPFAAHAGKVYPLPLMKQVVEQLNDLPRVKVFLFGSGPEEKAWCEGVAEACGNVVSLIGKSNLQKELRLMTNMNVMLTMDSANMHLSALAGTPTVSIWGATHPLAGFSGMQARGSKVLQLDMECRPCSIFGNKPCYKGDCPCMNGIAPASVVEAVSGYFEDDSQL